MTLVFLMTLDSLVRIDYVRSHNGPTSPVDVSFTAKALEGVAGYSSTLQFRNASKLREYFLGFHENVAEANLSLASKLNPEESSIFSSGMVMRLVGMDIIYVDRNGLHFWGVPYGENGPLPSEQAQMPPEGFENIQELLSYEVLRMHKPFSVARFTPVEHLKSEHKPLIYVPIMPGSAIEPGSKRGASVDLVLNNALPYSLRFSSF